jgi:hypothetical protein
LARLEGVPPQGHQSMIGYKVRDLDFLGDCVSSRDGGVARPQGRVINTLTLWAITCAEAVAGKPIITVASLSLRAIGTVTARLSGNIGAVKSAGLETVLCCLLLGCCGEVSRGQEQIHKSLILADTPTEHATMVTIVVQTPLHIYYVANVVGDDW